MKRLSLRWGLALVLVGFTGVVLLVQDVPLTSYIRDVERDRIVTGLQRDAFTLASGSEEPMRKGATGVPELRTHGSDYSARTGARVVITDATGTAVVTSDGTDLGTSYRNRPEIATALTGHADSGVRESMTLGGPLLYVAVPIQYGDQILGAVRLTYPAGLVDSEVDARVYRLELVGLVTLLAAAVIAMLVATAVTRRLRRLRDAAEQVAAGELSARVDNSGAGELGDLAASFNMMAARVQQLVEGQRDFAGDASHQLRTPLTALRLRLEGASATAAADPVAARQSLAAATAEVDRLQRLIDGLLMLARADGAQAARVRVDLAEVAHDRAVAWQPLAEERSARIQAVAYAPAWVWAVPGTVEQIVDNYVDNALEVTPPGGTITVRITRAVDRCVLSVEDVGPGLTAEQREHAFDRFWRAGTDGGGSGLGLAVVRSLARASGGEVRLEAASPEGTRALAVFAAADSVTHRAGAVRAPHRVG